MLKRVVLQLMEKGRSCLRRLDYTRTIRIDDVKVRIPSIRGITCELSEIWMIDLLRALLREHEGAFLDVGTNVGQTLVKVKALDPGRSYVGFEPNPVCVHYAGELVRANGWRNCTLLPIGLFDKDGIVPLDRYSDEPTDLSASVIDGFRPDQKICSRALVPVFRFDSVAGSLALPRVGIVKIDVEGAELEVITSLLELIRRDRPIILLEVLPVRSEENAKRKTRQEELERIFAEAGYAIFRVEKTGADRYGGLRRLESFGIHADLSLCDYVIRPNEHGKGDPGSRRNHEG